MLMVTVLSQQVNWTAMSPGDWDDTRQAILRHVLLFLFFFTLEYVVTLDVHWVKFFPSVQLKNSHVD